MNYRHGCQAVCILLLTSKHMGQARKVIVVCAKHEPGRETLLANKWLHVSVGRGEGESFVLSVHGDTSLAEVLFPLVVPHLMEDLVVPQGDF